MLWPTAQVAVEPRGQLVQALTVGAVQPGACSVFTLAADMFVDQRIYVDNAPVSVAVG